MRLHRRPTNGPGFTPVVAPGREMQHLGFGLLRLQPGESYTAATDGVEACLVILSGTCTIAGPGYTYAEIGERESVFAGRATSVYVPGGSSYTVTAKTPVAVAVCTAVAEAGGEPRLIRPADVVVNLRGKPGFRREVHDILDGRASAKALVLGETTNAVGEWSSYPPHKHDESRPGAEVKMEEIYFYQIDPAQGFGVQMLYTGDGTQEEAFMVKHGDVAMLPFGYHPVAAAPGYKLYYLWMMAGESRNLQPADDPVHAWVKNA